MAFEMADSVLSASIVNAIRERLFFRLSYVAQPFGWEMGAGLFTLRVISLKSDGGGNDDGDVWIAGVHCSTVVIQDLSWRGQQKVAYFHI